jgi:hypothetical protein
MTREITATGAGDRGMRSHGPGARHGIPCEKRHSGRCEEVATEPACIDITLAPCSRPVLVLARMKSWRCKGPAA